MISECGENEENVASESGDSAAGCSFSYSCMCTQITNILIVYAYN